MADIQELAVCGDPGANPESHENRRKLKLLIAARDREIKELKEALDLNQFSPAYFIINKTGDAFWNIINKGENVNDRIHRLELDYRDKFKTIEAENVDLKSKILKNEKTLTDLKKITSELSIENALHLELQYELEKLRRDLHQQKSKQYYQKHEFLISSEKVDFYQLTFDKFEGFLKGSINDYENERASLSNRQDKLKGLAGPGSCLEQVAGNFKKTEIFYSKDAEHNIEQLFTRFNTIPVDSEKFIEMLELLTGFYGVVDSDLKRIGDAETLQKEDKMEKIKASKLMNTFTSGDFYRHYVKGL
jgi:hypothetical protein